MTTSTPATEKLASISKKLEELLNSELMALDDAQALIDDGNEVAALTALDQIQLTLSHGVIRSCNDLRRVLIHHGWELTPR